jgi:hypothetical protein
MDLDQTNREHKGRSQEPDKEMGSDACRDPLKVSPCGHDEPTAVPCQPTHRQPETAGMLHTCLFGASTRFGLR